MSKEFYNIMHFAGLIFLFLGLGGILLSYATGNVLKKKIKVLAYACHGVGLTLLLVSGFGLLARLGLVQGLPSWVYVKLLIWTFFGLALSIARKKAQWTLTLIILFVGLGTTAATFGHLKIDLF
jgi:hypothetical protein